MNGYRVPLEVCLLKQVHGCPRVVKILGRTNNAERETNERTRPKLYIGCLL